MRYLLTFLLFFPLFIIAQNSGLGFNFQGIARDINGNVLKSAPVTLRIALYNANTDPTASNPDWQETHSITTDDFGVFALKVGLGSLVAGQFSQFNQLNFRAARYSIKVEIQEGSSTWVEIANEELASVPYAENTFQMPVGSIIPYAGTRSAAESLEAEGWYICDGRQLPSTDYGLLYTAIGNNWGGDASNFNIPDLRGLFLRGLDERTDGTTMDPDGNSRVALSAGGVGGRNVGSYQSDIIKDHKHYRNEEKITEFRSRTGVAGSGWAWHPGGPQAAAVDYTGTMESDYSSETRPKNVYVIYLIRVY